MDHFNFTPVPVIAKEDRIGSRRDSGEGFEGVIDLLRTGVCISFTSFSFVGFYIFPSY